MDDLRKIAEIADCSGVYLINSSYEWGCTSMVGPSDDGKSARLLRTLDWDFDGLGYHIEVVRANGGAGDYLSATWPGAVGVLTAMAPGRFSAAINQAPMRRRWQPHWAQPIDEFLNSLDVYWSRREIPPLHLLRRAFDEAPTFEIARTLLETTPVASPVIFSLAGIEPQQACIIERSCDSFETHEGVASAANDWRYGRFKGGWEAIGANKGAPRGDNAQRCDFIEGFATQPTGNFDWVVEPELSELTRLAVEADATQGLFKVCGFERDETGESARRVTKVFNAPV